MGLFLLAACAKGAPKAESPGATLGTAAPTTTTTNPYAVPPVIDAAYVNRVLAGLDAVVGDVIRAVVTAKAVLPDAIERLKAIYSDPTLLQLRIDSLQTDLRNRLSSYRADPGNVRTTVTQLFTAGPACIYAQVSRDFSRVALDPDGRLSTQWIALRPASAIIGSGTYNGTGWTLTYEGFERDLTAPRVNPCVPA